MAETAPELEERARMVEAANHLISLRNHVGWGILIGQLRRLKAAALFELTTVDAMNSIRIEQIQNEIKRYQWFMDTPEQLIHQGLEYDEAEDSLAEMEDDNG